MNLYSVLRIKELIVVLLLFTGSLNLFAQINISKPQFKLSWLYPVVNVKEVGKFDKLELGIKLNSELDNQINQFIKDQKRGLNPYNPEDLSIEVNFVSPTNNEKNVYGFYYQDFIRSGNTWVPKTTAHNWRIRFSPDEIGKWKFTMKIYLKGTEWASIGAEFTCVDSDSKGVIKRNYKKNEADRYFYLSETNETFFTVGENIAHSAYYKLTPNKAEQHKTWLTELAENGGNFFRLELGAQNGLPDWNSHYNYTTKLPHMWEFDQLVEHARTLNLYFILFRHHTEVYKGESWEVARWSNNPYKIGFNLIDRKGYFSNTEVLKWQKNALRYIFSRWGYNSSFAFYEYQEIDNWIKEMQQETDYNEQQTIEFFTEWYLKQKEYIKQELNCSQLFINTYATTPDYEYKKNSKGLFANSDAIGFHKYGQEKDVNFKRRYDKAVKLFDIWKKPVFVEEMGVNAGGNSDYLPIYKCNKSEFHNSIWSTSFMGTAGTGMSWWWDRGLHDFEYYKDFQAIANFFKGEKLEEELYEPQRWRNKMSMNKSTLASYSLKNKKETKMLGWVHNASHYWRNIHSDCLNELISEGKFEIPHKLKDGYVIGDKKEGNLTDFSKNKDAYSDDKGVQDITGEKFKLKGLKSGGLFGKKRWYTISFYSTETSELINTEALNTNRRGVLKPKFPTGNLPDYSYKISFLGVGKTVPK